MESISLNQSFSQIVEPKIEIKKTTKKGRGVFSKNHIAKDEIIESCQIIPFSADDADRIELTYLSNYWFAWRTDEDPNQYGAFCLGNGALYNHSTNPNAIFFKDYEQNLIHFIAIKEIPKGTEITVRYGMTWFKEEEDN